MENGNAVTWGKFHILHVINIVSRAQTLVRTAALSLAVINVYTARDSTPARLILTGTSATRKSRKFLAANIPRLP